MKHQANCKQQIDQYPRISHQDKKQAMKENKSFKNTNNSNNTHNNEEVNTDKGAVQIRSKIQKLDPNQTLEDLKHHITQSENKIRAHRDEKLVKLVCIMCLIPSFLLCRKKLKQ